MTLRCDASPVTMATMTGTELLRSPRAEAARHAALGTELRDRIDTLAVRTVAEARVQAVRAKVQGFRQDQLEPGDQRHSVSLRCVQTSRFRCCLDPPPGQLAEPITLRDKLACIWKQLLAAPSQISVAVDLRSMTK